MTVTYKETALIKVTLEDITGTFPQNISVPGLKAGDVVLSIISASGANHDASNLIKFLVTTDDELRVLSELVNDDPFTVILARL